MSHYVLLPPLVAILRQEVRRIKIHNEFLKCQFWSPKYEHNRDWLVFERYSKGTAVLAKLPGVASEGDRILQP